MRHSSLLLLAACSLATGLAQAQSVPKITFEGEVTDQTCQATIDGETNPTVILPTVNTAQFTTTGTTVGLTPVTLTISNCAAPSSGSLDISLKLSGQNIKTGGYLGNIAATNPATNVALQLTQNADGTGPITLAPGITTVPAITLNTGETGGTHTFGVQYISEGTPVSAGAVEGVVEYTLSYL